MIKLKDCIDDSLPPQLAVNPFLDLFAHLARCEANYSRLRKLLRRSRSSEFQSRTVEFANGSASLRFEHSRISRYTSSVVIRQTSTETLTNLNLKLHVYHDTKAAEVVSYQRHHDFRVLETRPAPPRTQRFEKIEMNRFLTELLDHCLTFGTGMQTESTTAEEQGSSV